MNTFKDFRLFFHPSFYSFITLLIKVNLLKIYLKWNDLHCVFLYKVNIALHCAVIYTWSWLIDVTLPLLTQVNDLFLKIQAQNSLQEWRSYFAENSPGDVSEAQRRDRWSNADGEARHQRIRMSGYDQRRIMLPQWGCVPLSSGNTPAYTHQGCPGSQPPWSLRRSQKPLSWPGSLQWVLVLVVVLLVGPGFPWLLDFFDVFSRSERCLKNRWILQTAKWLPPFFFFFK